MRTERVEESLGDYLRTSRIGRNISLRSFAGQLSIAPSYLSDIENNRRVPADELLRKLGEELDVDFHELLALAGKLDEEAAHFIKSQPEAVRLFRKIKEANLSAEQIRELGSQIPDRSQHTMNF